VRNGDTVTIGAEARAITIGISSRELAAQYGALKQPKPRYTPGILAKYAHTFRSASEGAIADADLK